MSHWISPSLPVWLWKPDIMQHTLLPIVERKTLRAEYRIRMLIVMCFMISVAGTIGIAALFPAFIRSWLEESRAESAATAIKVESSSSGLLAVEKEVADSSKLLSSLRNLVLEPELSSAVEGIVSLRGNVKLTSFAIARISTSTASVQIDGVAPTRDDLLSFKSRLETAVPAPLRRGRAFPGAVRAVAYRRRRPAPGRA